MRKGKVSDNAVRRLPRYFRRLTELEARGVERVSSGELARQMGITPSQIRQDLSAFGEFGVQGYGYNVAELKSEVAAILGAENGFKAILIGAGKIGRALVSNFPFADYGVELCCVFDVRDKQLQHEISVPICSMNDLEQYLIHNRIDIAVLTVPSSEAVAITQLLEKYGIDAIWNFTNAELETVSDNILVENLHFSDSLLTLSYYLSEKRFLANR